MKLSKINNKIQNLFKEIKQIEDFNVSSEFNTRGHGYHNNSHIVANIKVYEWLDIDDVLKYIKNENLEGLKDLIIEEFTEERLNGVYSHVCENEVCYLKEKYEDLVHLSDWRDQLNKFKRIKRDEEYLKATNIWMDKSYLKFLDKPIVDYWEYLYKHHQQEINERDKLESFERDCWQFGRRGGWFSICNVSELEAEFANDYYELSDDLLEITNNNEFNAELITSGIIEYYKDKTPLINDMLNFIEEWKIKKENITYFINEIEENKKFFKDSLLNQLYCDINNFIEDINQTTSNVTIQVSNSKILTSKGITISKDIFIPIYNKIAAKLKILTNNTILKLNIPIKDYIIEYAKKTENDILIKAGCHLLSWTQINESLQNTKQLKLKI